MSHIFIKTLLEMMDVVKSADNFIGNPVNTMAFFFLQTAQSFTLFRRENDFSFNTFYFPESHAENESHKSWI